jgi:hypothetical protein
MKAVHKMETVIDYFIFLLFVWRILHMGVDRESSEGVVYIKTLSTEDAGKVFRSVSPGHSWYSRISWIYLRK